MTRDEARGYLFGLYLVEHQGDDYEKGLNEALDMAIEALQREDDLLKSLETNEPLYDMVDVVRCKDCRYYGCSGLPCPLDVCESLGDDGFCSCGERKGGDNNEID